MSIRDFEHSSTCEYSTLTSHLQKLFELIAKFWVGIDILFNLYNSGQRERSPDYQK